MGSPLDLTLLASSDQSVTRLSVADVARFPLGAWPVGSLANPATSLVVHAMFIQWSSVDSARLIAHHPNRLRHPVARWSVIADAA